MGGLRYDFTGSDTRNLRAGHGISLEDISGYLGVLDGYLRSLREGTLSGGVPGFVYLPDNPSSAVAVRDFVSTLRPELKDVLVLGIGGSSLGPRALVDALTVPGRPGVLWNGTGRRMHFLDNVDPELIWGKLTSLDLRRTFVVVISKSGSTVETAAQLAVFLESLRRETGDSWSHHVCVITDPRHGPLRQIAQEYQCAAFEVPPEVGGRFSVLTPVGLLPLALAGGDPEALLQGAAIARETLCNLPAPSNPAALSAAIHVTFHKRGKPIRVLMPYRTYLATMAEWFQQLWAESLGKNVQSGSTPVRAVGVTDQHSQLQLYMEGPLDKVVNLWTVRESRVEVAIPKVTLSPEFSYLGGKSMSALLEAEYAGTRTALSLAGRPVVELIMDQMDERTLGALIFMLEIETAMAAELYRVNAYDQPAVELGKKFAFGLLERAGYESFRDRYASIEATRIPWRAGIDL